MLVPTPRKIKEMRKNAASTMDTNFTQKPSFSRFIIMAGCPPRCSHTETIVYHVTPDDRNRDPPAGRGLENASLWISVLGGGLDHGEVSPFPNIERTRLGLDTERARPTKRRKLEARSTAPTVELHGVQRLLEQVHAWAAPQPVGTHTDPDATGDHLRHGCDAAPEKVVRTGAVRRRRAGLRQHPYIFFRDSRRQVRGYGLGGEEFNPLRVAHGRNTRSSPLIATEDIGEATSTALYELYLLGALGEVDRQRPTQLAGLPRRQTRRFRVHGVRGMHADPRVYSLRQSFSKLTSLPYYDLDRLFWGADLVREELGVDGPRHPALGELRQAFPVWGGLCHIRRPRLYGLPGTVSGRLGRPGLLLGQTLDEPAQPSRERTSLGRVLPPETEVGVGVDRARNYRVVGEESDLGIGVPASDFCECSDGPYAPVVDEDGAVLKRRR